MEQKELMIRMILDAWYSHIKRTDALFDVLTDDDLKKEIAPGKNRGVYLLGHLTGVHNRLLPLLGLGEQPHAELDEVFLTTPDKSSKEMPPISDLRLYWKDINAKLEEHFNKLTPDEWFQKHTSVSEEDFKKEPYRNRLNVLVSRTNHLGYHLGQLVFLKK